MRRIQTATTLALIFTLMYPRFVHHYKIKNSNLPRLRDEVMVESGDEKPVVLCRACGNKLQTPTSRERGIGPVCHKKEQAGAGKGNSFKGPCWDLPSLFDDPSLQGKGTKSKH